jgi:adenylate kinase
VVSFKGRAMKENRPDDADENVIRNRLEVYEKNTAPILSHYPPDRIARVEATLTPIEVFNEILKIVTPIKVQFNRARGG